MSEQLEEKPANFICCRLKSRFGVKSLSNYLSHGNVTRNILDEIPLSMLFLVDDILIMKLKIRLA